MSLPGYQPFYLADIDQLRAEILRLGLDLDVLDDLSPLAEQPRIGERRAANRFCALPLGGRDAEPDGSPGIWTRRRYRRLAEGGFGLLWIEATAVTADARSHPAQLHLHERNVDAFARWVKELRAAARDRGPEEVLLILQLAHAGRAQRLPGDKGHEALVSDRELEALRETYARVAALAVEAGFDGVDVCACPRDLVSDLLAGFTRPGPFGGSFEGRTRFMLETIMEVGQRVPDAILASRLNLYHAVGHPYGFGVNQTDYRRPDSEEPVRLVKRLRAAGVSLLGVSAASPNLQGPWEERAYLPRGEADLPDEHPLSVLARHIGFAGALRGSFSGEYSDAGPVAPPRQEGATAFGHRPPHQEPPTFSPPLSLVGGGYTWLRQFLPQVAAGAVRRGAIDFAGLGRSALAYPDAPAEVFRNGGMAPGKCCMVCFTCARLFADGGPVGCVIRDHEVYGPEYRRHRRFDPEHLLEEARRCHDCEAAPCTAVCPTHTDIPAFLRAFVRDDVAEAYEVIRRRDALPEMTSHLSPSWLESEGACIETALAGRPVPILDIQYSVSWLARDRGLTAIRLPARPTGRRIAVVGGGPAGLAGAIRLLEQGHAVDLLEKEDRLGGTPEQVIPAARYPGSGPEVDAILQPALDARRLRLRFGEELGRTVTLEKLRVEFDAVLLAAGLWQESSLGQAEGVHGALPFLESVKRGSWMSRPGRVAVLAGGDTAMDAAVTAKALGADEMFVVFGASRAEMHWHLPDAWFATPGVHALMLCRPLGYDTDEEGRLVGVRICRMEPGPPSLVPDSESLLVVDLVIEAMGLETADELRDALTEIPVGDRGLIRTREAASFRTNLDNVFAAGALVNGGASVARCVAEGSAAAEEMGRCLI